MATYKISSKDLGCQDVLVDLVEYFCFGIFTLVDLTQWFKYKYPIPYIQQKVWKVSGGHMEGFWNVSGGFVKGVWRVYGGFL